MRADVSARKISERCVETGQDAVRLEAVTLPSQEHHHVHAQLHTCTHLYTCAHTEAYTLPSLCQPHPLTCAFSRYLLWPQGVGRGHRCGA